MFYDFPEIRTIDDVLPSIKDRKEFVVAEREGYVIINYLVNMPDTFGISEMSGKMTRSHRYEAMITPEMAIRRELRGIAFDENGDILSRSLHKFFNLGERVETSQKNVDFRVPHVSLVKLDGSMIRPLYFKKHNGFRLGTKMGITEVSMQAEVHISENLKYFRFFRECLANSLTPSFEWMSPKNRIVIDYKEKNLTLIAIRENVSGRYFEPEEMQKFASPFDIPVVELFPSDIPLDTLIKHVREKEDIEGIIFRFNNGHMLKLKTELYTRMHKSKDIVSNDRRIIELILEEKIDDIKPMLMQDDLARVERLETNVGEKIAVLSERLQEQAKPFRGMEKKTFALNHANELQPFFRKAVFAILDNDDANTYDIARKFIHDNAKADNRFELFQKEYDLTF